MSISTSTCKYLFDKEAKEIFTHLHVTNKSAFVDQALNLMIRVNIFFLTKKEGFFLIDPTTLNNQCHLHALRTLKIEQLYQNKTEEEKLAQTEENKFLHLSLFLHHSFSKKNVLMKVFQGALKEMGEKMPLPKKTFKYLLKDNSKHLEEVSRIALNHLFETHIKRVLLRDEPLYKELSLMAHENLSLISTRDKKFGSFYTYPKLAGVAYLVDTLERDNIPFVMKIKVMTKEGVAGTVIKTSRRLKLNESALVFEGVTTTNLPFSIYKNTMKACPFSFYQSDDTKHSTNETCLCCRKITGINLDPYRENVKRLMASKERMLYTLGTDFMLHHQQKFIPLFKNTTKYPLLSTIFREASQRIETLNSPFSICHVNLVKSIRALSPQLLMDTDPKRLLEERGIL